MVARVSNNRPKAHGQHDEEEKKEKAAEASKASKERSTTYRQRQVEMGMKRLEVGLHETTYTMLMELVQDAGYKVEKGGKGRGINGVLTQIIYEVYVRQDKVTLDKTDQQGFILAQKVSTLRASNLEPENVVKYIEKEEPSSYLGKEETEWNKRTLLKLIKDYKGKFNQVSPTE